MTKNELQALFDELCEKHYLDGWTLEFSPWMVKTLGKCWHSRKKIVLSEKMVTELPARAPETLRHEIAHAMAGASAGHDDLWKRMCGLVGAEPERLATVPVEWIRSTWNYVPVCRTCGLLDGGWVGKPNPNRWHPKCGDKVDVVRVDEVTDRVVREPVSVDKVKVDERVAAAVARRRENEKRQ